MGRAYKNPTEDMAIGRIMLDEKKRRRREMRKKSRSPDAQKHTQYSGRHRTSVWRDEESWVHKTASIAQRKVTTTAASATNTEVSINEGK